ncbi:MAG: hypothetical protein OXQ86_07790 [Gammaproteobacteria bacterium]|nr:hypothetical protein [Gammaproteobacteria bacterium]MDE0129451.1 hypothetical protein [Gammaproteobacteria bacterium]MDE0414475.1 hypothetical protein [Gammaproteobacteria bacterium]
MKRVIVIAASALAVIAVGAYFLQTDRAARRAADTEKKNSTKAFTLVEERKFAEGNGQAELSASPPSVAQHRTIEEAIAEIAPEKYRHEATEAKTEFRLLGGEIGYVDVESIVKNRDPYSLVALLQKHYALTGVDGTIELDIDRVHQKDMGYRVRYSQSFDGTPTAGQGSISFDTSGSVSSIDAILLNPMALSSSNINILQAEAIAVSRLAIARFLEPRRHPYLESGKPLIIETNTPPELRIAASTDANNELRAEWSIWAGTRNPSDSIEVLVDAETGQVLGTRSLLVPSTTPTECAAIEFRVCGGLLATTRSCDGSNLIFDGSRGCVGGSACNEARYKTPWNTAHDARNYVASISQDYLPDNLGVNSDGEIQCKVDIVVGNDGLLGGLRSKREAIYDPRANAIVIGRALRTREPATDSAVTAHELFHMINHEGVFSPRTRTGLDVEEGIVRALTALYPRGSSWSRHGLNDHETRSDDQDTTKVVGNTIYRIAKEITDTKIVFELVLEAAAKRPTSVYHFHRALLEAAEDMESNKDSTILQDAVDNAIQAMDEEEEDNESADEMDDYFSSEDFLDGTEPLEDEEEDDDDTTRPEEL